VVPETPALPREITERYLPKEKVQGHLDLAATFGEQVVIYLRPQRWLTGDLGPGDLPPGAQLSCIYSTTVSAGIPSQALTALSRTGETTPDLGALAGHPVDPDQRKRTTPDEPDVPHETTDQKISVSSR
jgi:hypothetical protein